MEIEHEVTISTHNGSQVSRQHNPDAMTVLRMINVITGMMRMPVTKEQLLELNAKLNRIPLA